MSSDPAIVSCDRVRYRWPGRDGFDLTIPQFHVDRSESVLILGRSGSGKSTLLSLICGIVTPDQGHIHVAGADLCAMSAGVRDRFRAEQIGVIFQQFNLLPYARVLDNILLPLRFAPGRLARAGHHRQAAADLCDALDLPAGVLTQTASRLSVGQQQRVAAVRALIGQPGLIVADEPTSALDVNSQSMFLDALFAQADHSGAAIIMVSHDDRLADRFDRVVHMHDIGGAP